jgi:hypothetical protein
MKRSRSSSGSVSASTSRSPAGRAATRLGSGLAAEVDLGSQVVARMALALVRSDRGLHDDAIHIAREAVEMYAETESPLVLGDAWMTLAEVLQAGGQAGEAAATARIALSFYERKGVRPAIASTKAFLGALEA